MRKVTMQPKVEWIDCGSVFLSVQAIKPRFLNEKGEMQLSVTSEPVICFEEICTMEISKNGSMICPITWDALRKLQNSIAIMLEHFPEQ